MWGLSWHRYRVMNARHRDRDAEPIVEQPISASLSDPGSPSRSLSSPPEGSPEFIAALRWLLRKIGLFRWDAGQTRPGGARAEWEFIISAKIAI